jgi:hypothetical protein
MYTVTLWLFCAGAVTLGLGFAGVVSLLDVAGFFGEAGTTAASFADDDDGGACSLTLDAFLFTVIVWASDVKMIVPSLSVR